MASIKLPDKSIAQLSSMVTQYVTTLKTIVDALGLEGTWTFEPLTGSLVSKEQDNGDRTS